MLFLYNDKTNASYTGIMEDVDPVRKRIFIGKMGMDIDTLNVRFGEFFAGQSIIDQYTPQATGDNYRNEAPIQTAGKWVWGFNSSTGRNSAWAPPGHMDPWFASLDYENVPGRRSFKTSTGLIVYQQFSNYSTNDGTTDFWVGSDMAGPAHFFTVGNGNFVTIFGEDTNNDNSYWAISYDNGTYYVGKIMVTKSAVTWNSQRTSTAGQLFYLGKNVDGSVIFIEHNGTTNQLLGFTHAGYLAAAAPTQTFTGWISNASVTHYQYPSNLYHKSSTEKVFYQGEYDSNIRQEFKELSFMKYVWNPNDGSISQSLCSVVYPSGKSYIDYHRMVWWETTYHSATTNCWYYKPHLFKFNGVQYLTYIFTDKSGAAFWAERMHFDNTYYANRWITYTVSADGNTLTYHSTYEWPLKRGVPLYYMPTNSAGTQMIVPLSENFVTLSFNPTAGWYTADTEMYSVRSLGIDSAGRIYMGTRFSYYDVGDSNTDGKGYFSMYQYIPPDPIYIDVSSPTTSAVYQGSTITSSLVINALDASGNRSVRNVKLSINNSCMTFLDGTTVKTITTSASADTTVSVLIIGAGKPVVLASVMG